MAYGKGNLSGRNLYNIDDYISFDNMKIDTTLIEKYVFDCVFDNIVICNDEDSIYTTFGGSNYTTIIQKVSKTNSWKISINGFNAVMCDYKDYLYVSYKGNSDGSGLVLIKINKEDRKIIYTIKTNIDAYPRKMCVNKNNIYIIYNDWLGSETFILKTFNHDGKLIATLDTKLSNKYNGEIGGLAVDENGNLLLGYTQNIYNTTSILYKVYNNSIISQVNICSACNDKYLSSFKISNKGFLYLIYSDKNGFKRLYEYNIASFSNTWSIGKEKGYKDMSYGLDEHNNAIYFTTGDFLYKYNTLTNHQVWNINGILKPKGNILKYSNSCLFMKQYNIITKNYLGLKIIK